MLGNGGIYAAKKRKKPVQKILKASPVDGIAKKTNPSKRHRDRLNGELDRLTGLLPFSQEVRGRLDKLSVLRLSVGYLKVKSFFHKTLHKSDWSAPSFTGNGRNGHTFSIDRVSFSEGDLLLQALNGFVLVVTTDGSIFYASPTVQDYLGFHQSDVVHQSVYELIHMDDRDIFRSQLHFALNPIQIHSEHGSDAIQSSTKHVSDTVSYMPQHIPPENSSFLERSFCCRFRCLLDNSSGFLALNFQGRLKYVHGQGRLGDDGTAVPPQLAMFAIATPLQLPAVMEIRTKTLIFQTKHRLDFAPMGIDTRGKVVLGYSETEITTRGSGYQFLHAADMMYCADNHLRMMKTGESGFTTFRLLTKTGVWVWVQANARLVFKAGRPDFIIARQKSLTNEEGEEHLRQRRMQLPFNFATGEGVLYESFPSLDTPVIPSPNPPGPRQSPDEKPLDPASLLGSLLSQDLSVYTQPQKASAYPQPLDQEPALDPQLSLERAFLDSHALLSVPGQIQVPQRRTSRGDPTAQAMMDSLGEILGEMGYGGMEGLEVEEKELRDWESALLRMNLEREEVTGELNGILANDVFSYVEEALLGDSNAGGRVIGLEQTGSQGVEPINSLSVHLPTNQNTLGGTCHSLPSTDHSQSTMLPCNQGHYGTNGTHKNNTQWQAVANMNSNLNSVGEQGLLGNVEEGRVVGGIQRLRCSPGVVMDPHKAVHRPTHKQPSAAPTQEGGTTSQGQCTRASSRYHHGNQIVPPTAHSIDQILPVLPDQPWIPSIQNTNHNHNLHSNFNNNLADAFNQSMQQCSLELNHCGTVPTDKQFSGHPYSSPPFQGLLQPWQQTSWQLQQQLPHGAPGGVANGHQISEHHHTLTHTTHKPSPTGPRAHTLTHSPLTPSGSCMFERRGHAPASAPTRANGSIPVLTHSNESVSTPTFTKYTRTIPFTPASIPTPTPSQLNTAALPAWSGATYQGIKQLQTPFPSSQLVPYMPGSCSVPSEGTSAMGQGEPRGSHCPGAPTSGYAPENGSIQASHLYWNRQT